MNRSGTRYAASRFNNRTSDVASSSTVKPGPDLNRVCAADGEVVEPRQRRVRRGR